ncbi:MAG TPA: alpha/beta hydrolase [Caulobacteraceae bacterium]|nr:alpha/beta hydrolase [Caulobacteraceae bacterium]
MIETHAVKVGDMAFTTDLAGPTDGPTVLMLHGFPQSRWAWRRQLPALAEAGFRGVAPDQRGYSPGARPAETDAYAAANMVADALGIMDALDAERFHLIGHDWGGQIAWMVAAAAPERIKSLAVLSRPHPAAFAAAWKADPEQAGRSRHHSTLLEDGAAARIRENDMAAFRTMFERQGVGAEDAEAYCKALGAPGALEAAIQWYRAAAGALRAADFPAIATPTLYLWGDADATVGRAAAEATGGFVTADYRFEVVPGAGHFLTDQVPATVNRTILAHLRAHA